MAMRVNNQIQAQEEAIAQAVERLTRRGVRDAVRLRVFGRDLSVMPPRFLVKTVAEQAAIGRAERILVLHYLLSERPIQPEGRWISFRDLPGGQFYLKPYRSRTVNALAEHFGNDLKSLRERLDAFDWETLGIGDLGLRSHPRLSRRGQ